MKNNAILSLLLLCSSLIGQEGPPPPTPAGLD